MTGAHPTVSIVVPCYNSAASLPATLGALVAQTRPAIELLLADDASTDATPDLLAAFAAARPGTVVLRRERNLGWIANTNDLMARVRGELLAFGYHDDLPAPDHVERLARALMDAPEAVLAFSDIRLTEADGRSSVRAFPRLDGVASPFHRG